MHLSLIQEGEELEKRAKADPDEQHEVATWLYLNRKDLLEAARWAVEHQGLNKGEVHLSADGKSITLDISAWQEKGIAPSRAMQIIIDIASRVMYPPNQS